MHRDEAEHGLAGARDRLDDPAAAGSVPDVERLGLPRVQERVFFRG